MLERGAEIITNIVGRGSKQPEKKCTQDLAGIIDEAFEETAQVGRKL